ncbi:MAG: hypothetical protein OHK0044_26100 [Burkholderiaceae bacterium]
MDEANASQALPRTVDAGRGIGWWSDAWTLFAKNPGVWIVLALIMIAIYIGLHFIPFVGGIAGSLILPPLAAGWLLAARKVERGGTLEIGDLFAGFTDKLTPLLVVGALLLVAGLVIMLIAGALGFGAGMGMFMDGARHGAGGMMAAFGAAMLALLVAVALATLLAMALWFAPALVVFRDVAPVDAMKRSFAACLKNIVPFLLYGVVYVLAAVVASIPFGLGWIVLLPVLMLTAYTSYKDVFGD